MIKEFKKRIVYTVDFEYVINGQVFTYNLAGGGSIGLKRLLPILGVIEEKDAAGFVENAIENVTFSDPELVEVIHRTPFLGFIGENDWILKSLQPFSTDETLTIDLKDGRVITIKVTDVQESTDLSNFLTNMVITGAVQNENGQYVVEANKEYTLIANFGEGSSYQFADRQTLTYQMPRGIKVLNKQEGTLTVNIVYKGRTYQVGASYSLGTDGKLEINFDQRDPDFPRLEESTNVSFRFNYRAVFDNTETHIRFNDEIERDIIFDEPTPGQAYVNKTGTFDETTGKFNYTIKVTATGDVTNVNVKDVISGDALIFNNDVSVSGNSSTYTNNGATNGFDYTFASMREGEEITITYSARVNFDKDTDGDGKLTVDQTKNTVTTKPDGGDPHNSEYSREIDFKTTSKSDGTEAGTTADGNKIINWTIHYNQLALAKAGGDTIKDTIGANSQAYMKYYGNGITVKVYDHSGNLVDTRNVPYSSLTAHSDSSWTYTIPNSDTTPYHYEITYQTVVDMEKVNQGGVTVSLDNDGNGDHGGISVTPKELVDINKSVESFTTDEVNWTSTISVPEGGLAQAVVTDYLPRIWLNGANHYDVYKDGSLEITGLLPGESYIVDTNTQGQVVITFYKDAGKTQTGLKETPGGHNITVKLTTKVDQEWLQKGYETGNWEQNHINTIDINGKPDTATVTYGKPGIKKTGVHQGERSFMYTVVVSGVSKTPISIQDTFDRSLLEVDTSKEGTWNHMQIWGGNQYSQDAGRTPISYTDTEGGVILTANSVPMQPDGHYYPYYKICYFLKLKDNVDLQQLAIANGGEHHLINTAKWGDHESEFDYTTVYDYLDKKLLNEGELGGTGRKAQYQITFNPAKATLNEGEPMDLTDTMSSNLSIDYSSIRIVTDPEGVSVPYSHSGGTDGQTVATFRVPDSTKVVITYDAMVVGNGSQKIINKVSVNGKEDTVENTKDYGAAGEGEGAIASFKIVKVDGYDANKKLSGVTFRITSQNKNIHFDDFPEPKGTYSVNEIYLTTNDKGEIVLDGDQYSFYFNELYYVHEMEPPDEYGSLPFDYQVTLTKDMSLVDYGHYVYYYADSMQIKNWPLEGLVVEKVSVK